MIIKKHFGINYYSATTRKANHFSAIFGKLTLWPNKEAYDNGNCDDVITLQNIFLGHKNTDDDNPKFFEKQFDLIAAELIKKRKEVR